MRYRTADGMVIEAADPAGIVAELNRASFEPRNTPALFMREAAARAEMQTGHKPIRSDTPEHFLHDLVEAGLLKEV